MAQRTNRIVSADRLHGPSNKARVLPEPCGPEDIAPTLALILGLQLQREQDSRLLVEMLSGNRDQSIRLKPDPTSTNFLCALCGLAVDRRVGRYGAPGAGGAEPPKKSFRPSASVTSLPTALFALSLER